MTKLYLLSFFFLSTVVLAQKQITVEDIYTKGTFYEQSVDDINWMNDGRYYSARYGNDILKFEVATGENIDKIFDGNALPSSTKLSSYSFNADESKILLMTNRKGIYRRSYTAQFYVYDVQLKSVKKLSENGAQSYATLSPDGLKVAFVRDNNLFYVNLTNNQEIQITDDGRFNHIINGSADWVYEEEFSLTKTFEWSEDSKFIFYLTFDESNVREYNIQLWNNGQLYPDTYSFKYPKAGEENAKLSATIFNLENNRRTPVDIGTNQEYYIARIKQISKAFSLVRLNRLQNELDILHVEYDGKVNVVLTEKDSTYIDVDFVDELLYLEDGKHFIHASERSGFKHLYLYSMNGKLVNQITQGEWEVSELVGVNQSEKKPTIYFTSTEQSSLERQLYSVNIFGDEKKMISKEAGWHTIDMSGDCTYYIDSYSNPKNPLQVKLYDLKNNRLIKILQDNTELVNTLQEYDVAPKEYFTFSTVDGTELNGYLMKPMDFEEKRGYPLLIFQYSGPGSQQVKYNWGGGANFYWHQMLIQKGYIVAVVDTRGTGAKGAKFKKMTYKDLGKYEVQDHIAAAKFLGGLSYVNQQRIGIWGWSYGGYISSLAMFLGDGVFKSAIAVAPVTNWRFYDTVYTERYMGLPKDNTNGYDDNSPTSHVEKLNGKFLLIHGTGDDNVHFQNAVTLQNALIAKGKQFDSFYYPDRSHGIYESNARPHLFSYMTNWIIQNL